MFCAAWTILAVLIAGLRFADHAWVGYVRIAVEAVAMLSWFAGFIAVAVNIGSDTCPARTCADLRAATVFGAFEWLLFMTTTILTTMLVLNGTRRPKTSETVPL
jgi:hypothetical protein